MTYSRARFVARCFLLFGALLPLCLQPSFAAPPYAERVDVLQFIEQMETRNGFSSAELAKLFAQIEPQEEAIKYIMPPKEPGVRSWQAYRARYIEPTRINRGLEFWRTHRQALEEARRRFGVPEEIIVAIIGVETIYGRHTGNFPTLATLATLAFDYPPRAELFRRELEAFLLLQRERREDPLSVHGSFAGAIGLPQFLPSSIRSFAVDFDNDSRIDLVSDAADAIGSVGNFLSQHGWRSGQPVAVRAAIVTTEARALADGSVLPRHTPGQLQGLGVYPREAVPADAPCALIDLVTPERDTEYWLGFDNFYVITRYNRSSFYAMAVYELSRELRSAFNAWTVNEARGLAAPQPIAEDGAATHAQGE